MANISLDIGLQALLTSQANLDVIGHNMANASTPGYSRQSLLTSAVPGQRLQGLMLGRGVQADVVQRTVDSLLQARILGQTSSTARLGARLRALSDAETYVGSTGDSGVPKRLADFFASLSSLSSAPADSFLRSGAVQSAGRLAGEVGGLANDLEDLRRQSLTELSATVKQVNALAQQIEGLGRRIPEQEAGGGQANDLRDQRDELVRELSQLVNVRFVEQPNGSARVLIGGHQLVGPSGVNQLALVQDSAAGEAALRLGSGGPLVSIDGGRMGGLAQVIESDLPALRKEIDAFAKGLALETGRVHSTGLPASGPFTSLRGTNAVQDFDNDGVIGNELLSNAGLPFDVTSGTLFVTMTDTASGAIEKHALTIDAKKTSVDGFVQQLDGVPGLNAKLDGDGTLRLFASPGYAFDFSPRLDPTPDHVGSFGGDQASLGAGPGPFALADGQTLNLTTASGPVAIAFDAADFAQIGAATAGEVAAVLNADPNLSAAGLTAAAVGEHLVLQTVAGGSGTSFTVAGGTALAGLGWSAGTTVSGHDQSVQVSIAGSYTGADNRELYFQPTSDGTVGTTPGLEVEVLDANGVPIATLSVGAGYSPGDELELPDGMRISIGPGELSASDGDVFRLDAVADADETDVLVALGLNTLYEGHDAETLKLRTEIENDPDLLAASHGLAAGDAAGLLALLALDSEGVESLGGRTLSERFTEISAGLGQEINATESTLTAEGFLLSNLEERRAEVSGVNVDEELVRMIEQERAYATASQFLRVVNDLQNDLLNIL